MCDVDRPDYDMEELMDEIMDGEEVQKMVEESDSE